MKTNEQLLKDLLQQFINKSGRQRLYDERRVLSLWDEVVDPVVAQNTQCKDIQKGVLTVKVTNAALRFELLARKSEIIKQLNENLGVEVVKDVIFR
ncbi:MAG: DUF721 domain-containing protein [Bacteroidales bacterium]|nr:DUF721 domain-containing protein [Bacteroidales bacterium]